MSDGAIFGLVLVVVVVGLIGWAAVWKHRDLARLAAMPPEEAEAIRRARRERLAEAQAHRQELREGAAARRQERLATGPTRRQPISQFGESETGQLVCPKCKGAQFKARRSRTARIGIATTTVATGGIGGLAATAATRRRQVQCVTCGTKYLRG